MRTATALLTVVEYSYSGNEEICNLSDGTGLRAEECRGYWTRMYAERADKEKILQDILIIVHRSGYYASGGVT